MATADIVTMDKIVSLCKRRGFIFPSSEIYGGIGSSYDYGHYGVLLKNNVKAQWWRAMLQERDDVVALDSAIIQHPVVAVVVARAEAAVDLAAGEHEPAALRQRHDLVHRHGFGGGHGFGCYCGANRWHSPVESAKRPS